MKIFSRTIATALMVAMSGVLLYVGLNAVMLRAEVLLPGAVLRQPAAPAKGVVLLFKDATRAPQAADYGAALLTLSYAVLDMPNLPPSRAVLDALAEQLAVRTGSAARAPVPPAEFSALLQCLDPGIDGQGQASARLRGIPLIELPVAQAQRAVIFWSGDGGWATLDRGVAAALNAQGIAVLGWDSLSYCWQARSAAVLARDLERVIDEFHARWRLSELVIAGYSFGANTVPFAVSGLAPATRKLIEKVVLLGPTATTSFEFRLAQWLGSAAHDSAAVAPEVAKLAPLPVWCVQAAQDREACCRPPAPPSQVLILPGDHHFNGDYAALARVIAAPLLTP